MPKTFYKIQVPVDFTGKNKWAISKPLSWLILLSLQYSPGPRSVQQPVAAVADRNQSEYARACSRNEQCQQETGSI